MSNFVMPAAYVHAQLVPSGVLNLPQPGAMVSRTSGFVPCIIKGITIHPENPLRFDFILETGDEILTEQEIRDCSRKLIKYFLASLTVPEKKLWVNLSPYESDRIVSPELGRTEMGRDMLAQDYILKQLTSSMMYPENNLGAEFWYRVYTKAQEFYGTTDIPLNTFNKIWIVPEKAEIFELGTRAFVVNSHLKVMLEEDYLALQQNLGQEKFDTVNMGMNEAEVISNISTQVVREVLIPEIEKEVNTGENFAQLRQIYHSLVLATWYKLRLKESFLNRVYANKGKTKGVETQDKEINTKIYKQYLEAFQKGVYNYIKEDYDPATQQVIPRKYFSGGMGFDAALLTTVQQGIRGQFGLDLTREQVAEAIRQLSPVQRQLIEEPSGTRFLVTTDLAELGRQARNLGEIVQAIQEAEPTARGQVTFDAAMLSQAEIDQRMAAIEARVTAAAEATVAKREEMRLPAYSARAMNYFKSVFRQYLVTLDQELPQVQQAILDENFFGTASAAEQMGLEEVRDLVGWVDNQQILDQETELLAWARENVVHISNGMNAGKGTSVDRESMLPTWWGRTEIGAKGTDTGWIQKEVIGRDAAGQEKAFVENISVAEFRLLNFLSRARDLFINQLEEVVSVDSAPWLEAALDNVYLFDRIDDRIPQEDKRTYRQVINALQGEGVRFVDYESESNLQEAVPNILIETGELVSEIQGTDVLTPGGHGQIWTDKLLETLDRELAEGKVTIRSIVNADGMANDFSPAQLAFIARNRIPIAIMGSIRLPLDAKGGILGLRQMPDGSYALDILELAAATTSGKAEAFQAEGLTRGMLGTQVFNTNNVAANLTILKPFLNDLRGLLGEEAFYSVVTGDLMGNPKTKEGRDVIQMETVMAMAVLKLHQYLEVNRKTNPALDQLMQKHGIDRLVNVIVVDSNQRTDHFTPVKFSWDLMLYFFSDHFALDVDVETQSVKFRNLREGHLPGYDMSKPYKVTEASYLALGRGVSMIGLDHLQMQGERVEMQNVVLRGNVSIENLSGQVQDINPIIEAIEQFQRADDGRIILENVSILINQQGQSAVQFDAAMLDQGIRTAVETFAELVQANTLQIYGALYRSVGQENIARFIREASGLTETQLPQAEILAMTNPVQGTSLEMISARSGVSIAAIQQFIQENIVPAGFVSSFQTLLSDELESAAVSAMVQEAWKVFAPFIAPGEEVFLADLAVEAQGADLAMLNEAQRQELRDLIIDRQNRKVVPITFPGHERVAEILEFEKRGAQTYPEMSSFQTKDIGLGRTKLKGKNYVALFFMETGHGIFVTPERLVEAIDFIAREDAALAYHFAVAAVRATDFYTQEVIARMLGTQEPIPIAEDSMRSFREILSGRAELRLGFTNMRGTILTALRGLQGQAILIDDKTRELIRPFLGSSEYQSKGIVLDQNVPDFDTQDIMLTWGLPLGQKAWASFTLRGLSTLIYSLYTSGDLTNRYRGDRILKGLLAGVNNEISSEEIISATYELFDQTGVSGRGRGLFTQGNIRLLTEDLAGETVLIGFDNIERFRNQAIQDIGRFTVTGRMISKPTTARPEAIEGDQISIFWTNRDTNLINEVVMTPADFARMMLLGFEAAPEAAENLLIEIRDNVQAIKGLELGDEAMLTGFMQVLTELGVGEEQVAGLYAMIQEAPEVEAGAAMDEFLSDTRLDVDTRVVDQFVPLILRVRSDAGVQRQALTAIAEQFPGVVSLAGLDQAQLEPVGGIDLNPELLDLQIKRDGEGFPLPLDQQPIDDMQIEGFLPVIINVTPVNSLPLLLGLSEEEAVIFDAAWNTEQPADTTS